MASAASGSDWQPTRRGVLVVLGLMSVLGSVGRVRAEAVAGAGVSDWSALDHARVRLIDAGRAPLGPDRRLVGLQIELDPGYLTYWRSPGEAGLPPTLTFPGATGLASVDLLFPAPGRFSEGGTEAIGYKDAVLFPLLVSPKEPSTPVDLKLQLDFAICERLCLPARAAASLTLDGDGATPEAALVREALARVPAPARIGDPGALAVVGVTGTAGEDTLTVRVRSDGSDVPLLFAEAPDPWFVQAGEGLWSNDGTLKYKIKVLAKPAEPASLPLRLTLVGSERAIEASLTLDAPPPKP